MEIGFTFPCIKKKEICLECLFFHHMKGGEKSPVTIQMVYIEEMYKNDKIQKNEFFKTSGLQTTAH